MRVSLLLFLCYTQQVFNEQFFQHSFLFPDLTLVTPELRDYITDSLLEKSHKVVLERSGEASFIVGVVCCGES